MIKLNFILFFILVFCALGLVTSQHMARKLYVELQQQEDVSKQLDTEWSQLQLEQSTWAMHSRLDQVAGDLLHMHVPDTKHIQIVYPDTPSVTKVTQGNNHG
jgi:cell division protein FtsL